MACFSAGPIHVSLLTLKPKCVTRGQARRDANFASPISVNNVVCHLQNIVLFQPFSAKWRIAENEEQYARNTYKYKS